MTDLEERNKIMSDTGAQPSPPYYPDCIVTLVGENGNAFAIMGEVKTALRGHLKERGIQPEIIKAATELYFNESMAGDYDHLLRTAMNWVTVK